ncbi:MAG: hypothetical protein K2H55_07910 [Helicobacter sp.]|nr:hypothetical protein [Helicobacter sp.]
MRILCSLIATLVTLARNDEMFRLRLNMTTHPLPPSAREGVQNPQKKRAQSYGKATAQRRFGFCYL